jgi:hypothetical protein
MSTYSTEYFGLASEISDLFKTNDFVIFFPYHRLSRFSKYSQKNLFKIKKIVDLFNIDLSAAKATGN